MVVWIVILSLLLLFLLWILLSSIVFEIDTRLPRAGLQWPGIGNAWIWYEGEWWLSFRIFFYTKKILLSEIKGRSKPRKPKKKKPRKNLLKLSKKMIRVIRSFRIKEWQAAIDTGDFVLNAQLYPLSFLPGTSQHLSVNFRDDSFLFIKIQNNLWRIIYAFIK